MIDPLEKTKKVKRLVPTPTTLRELYLKSGNQCAFTDCDKVMMDSKGNFVGQLCHIEAAETGGQRFNEKMTNEERRAFSNLMLMCYPHHVETNDFVAYPTPRMQQMKADHEAKFSSIVAKIAESITDQATSTKISRPTTLKRWNNVLKWHFDHDQLMISLRDIISLQDQLHKLPRNTRRLLTIALQRLKRIELKTSDVSYRYEGEITAEEVRAACEIELDEMKTHIAFLEKYSIAELDAYDEDNVPAKLCFASRHEWFILGDMLEFCTRTQTPLSSLVEELNFSLLD